jgi:hypothetical protein
MYERKSMNKPWSTLPNAPHIDWVLASVKENPELWIESYHGRSNSKWLLTALGAATDAARGAAWDAVWDEVTHTGKYLANVIRLTGWDDARKTARNAATALIAYDDCDQYLALGYEKLKVYAVLSEKPQALLLLPMAYVREKINEQALV